MTGLLQDLRYAFRQLRKNPGFTAVTVLTLALGIGVNAAMFAVIDGVLLRPFPFPKPNQIVQMSEASPTETIAAISSLPDIRDWRAQSHSFQDIGWYTEGIRSVDIPGFSDFIPVIFCSANVLQPLQVEPALGRDFMPTEDQPGHGDVVLINSVAWEKFFNKNPQAVGSSLKLGNKVYTVIGVMPARFEFPYVGGGPAVWSPLLPTKEYLERDSRTITALGRLKPGVSIAAAQAELSGIQLNIASAFPKLELDKRVVVKGYREVLTGNVRPALVALQFAVLAVWLIACANVASLLLSRTSGRRREIAIRSAIGAARTSTSPPVSYRESVLAITGAAAWPGARVRLCASPELLPRSVAAAFAVHPDRHSGSSSADCLLDPFGGALRTASGHTGRRTPPSRKRYARAPPPRVRAYGRNAFATLWSSARSRCPWCCWFPPACCCAAC